MAAGCVSAARAEAFAGDQRERARIDTLLKERRPAADMGLAEGKSRSLAEWLGLPEVGAAALCLVSPAIASCDRRLLDQAVQDHRYAPYLDRQQAEIDRLRQDERLPIPHGFDYSAVPGLSNEMIERLSASRPGNIGEAGRIRGVTPAALSAILVASRRKAA
jgi:tRNA uridine 5-carboxymethylaminomethyl modification enzyme